MKIVIRVENVLSQLIEKRQLRFAYFYKMLKSYLCVKVPGAHFIRGGRRGWDGMKYFINAKGMFPTGMLPMVIKHIKKEGHKVIIIDARENKIKFKKKPVADIGTEKLRPYQLKKVVLKAYKHAENKQLPWHRGMIDAATNTGKNYIMASLYFSLKKPLTLLVIHNQDSFDELYGFFQSFLGDSVGRITSKYIDIEPFTIAMKGSLYNRAQKHSYVMEYLNEVELLFVDEAHMAGGATYAELLSWINAYARYFVSGTIVDMDSLMTRLNIYALCGPVIAKITNQYLIKHKWSLSVHVKFLYNGGINLPAFTYPEHYRFGITENATRMLQIKEYVEKYPDKQILINVKFIEHGERLARVLGTVFLHSGSENRKQIVQDLKDNKQKVLVTTLLKESINAKYINTIIMAGGGKAKIAVKQIVGRGTRTDGINTELEIIEFYDDYKYLNTHSRKRLKIYKNEGFNISFNYEADGLGRMKRGTSTIKKFDL